MLRNTHDLKGCTIAATDGDIGHVKDFYFDDRAWMVRYLVVDTGSWLLSRKVLVSPVALGPLDWAQRKLQARLTREQVRDSPDVDTDKPVSRQHEQAYLSYYGYPFYWDGAGMWGGEPYPVPPVEELAAHSHDDPHLRSCAEVVGYHIQASDGPIGHVHSLLLDDASWAVRYCVVSTSNWWLGHQVLIAPQWISAVNWESSSVSVNLSRQSVQDAPPYDAATPLDREAEEGLHEHYGRTGYWGQPTGPEIRRLGE
jgi:hypothetical protein